MPQGTRADPAFTRNLEQFRGQLDPVLERMLPRPSGPERRVVDAMRYAVLGEGKRLRPYILNESARMFGVEERARLRTGAALELMHAYSLVHDDLPAMDDDDLRRGRPTCHIAFDEATAILAGDALQALAFRALASGLGHPDALVQSTLVFELAGNSGSNGMVGGQIVDLHGNEYATLEDRLRLARMKTGALFAFAAEAGAILGLEFGDKRTALREFGAQLGILYQIVDDLLDEEGDEKEVGKRLRKDARAGKRTLVSLRGVEGARAAARDAHRAALDSLQEFGARADSLRSAAHFILERSR